MCVAARTGRFVFDRRSQHSCFSEQPRHIWVTWSISWWTLWGSRLQSAGAAGCCCTRKRWQWLDRKCRFPVLPTSTAVVHLFQHDSVIQASCNCPQDISKVRCEAPSACQVHWICLCIYFALLSFIHMNHTYLYIADVNHIFFISMYCRLQKPFETGYSTSSSIHSINFIVWQSRKSVRHGLYQHQRHHWRHLNTGPSFMCGIVSGAQPIYGASRCSSWLFQRAESWTLHDL